MFSADSNDIDRSIVNRRLFSGEFVQSAGNRRFVDLIRTVSPVTRVVASTAVWGVAYQIVAALVQLISLGYLIRLVGREQFGLWMVIYALTMWAPLLLFGQSNVILTRLGQTIFADSSEARRILTASLVVCMAAAGLALLMVFVLVPFVPWSEWLHINDAGALAQAVPTAIAAAVVAIAAVPASLSSFALLACRRGVLNHQIMIAAQLAGLPVFLLGIMVHWPLWALGSVLIAPLVVVGVILFAVGIRSGCFPRPEIASVDLRSIKKTFGSALTIFSFNLAAVFLQRTPELFVARFRGINEVAAFAAGSRLSLFLLAIIQAILIAIWPMISEAAGRNDWGWVRRALIASLGAILLVWAAGSTAIWLLGPFFIEKWTGIPQLVSGTLFMAIILQALSQGLQSWIFTALGALSMYKTQLFAAIGAVAVYFVLAPRLGPSFGAVGVLLAQSVGILLLALPIGVFAVVRCIQQNGLMMPVDRTVDRARPYYQS
jgi:O-antigen/teichoic acid export membrane protein